MASALLFQEKKSRVRVSSSFNTRQSDTAEEKDVVTGEKICRQCSPHFIQNFQLPYFLGPRENSRRRGTRRVCYQGSSIATDDCSTSQCRSRSPRRCYPCSRSPRARHCSRYCDVSTVGGWTMLDSDILRSTEFLRIQR